MQQITEEMNVHEKWFDEAKDMTLEKLPEFLKKLTGDYGHDYGTICHSMAAGAIATIWAMDKSEQGGITGFQAGAIMWEFIRNWNHSGNKTGLRLVDYDKLLYPQYEDRFDKTISTGVWELIQKAARDNIEKADKKYEEYLKNERQYKKDIADFVVKYPDYYERKNHYDPLGIGNGDQWEEERKKKEGGFDFAPQEPHKPIHENSPVYQHWVSIANGYVPFGYSIEE